jgi:hypothetical protein
MNMRRRRGSRRRRRGVRKGEGAGKWKEFALHIINSPTQPPTRINITNFQRSFPCQTFESCW